MASDRASNISSEDGDSGRAFVIQGPKFSYRIVGKGRQATKSNLEEGSFDLLLLDRGGLPAEALEAPLASWVLARLTAEAGLGGAYADARQTSDGGAFRIDLEVTRKQGEPIATLELLGYTWCVELLGFCQGVSPGDVIDDLAGLLLNRPLELGRCRFSVLDTEWRDHPEDYDPRWPAESDRNVYGWNGTRFLGTENFWSEAEIDHPWPGESYRDYHEHRLRAFRDSAKTEKLGVVEKMGPPPELDDDDATDDVVAEVRADLRRFLRNRPEVPVLLKVYDLDGRLVQDEPFSQEVIQAKVESWVGEGFNADWCSHDGELVVKVWEYPASEPPWSVVHKSEEYEPSIEL